jgi:hypothetical protein
VAVRRPGGYSPTAQFHAAAADAETGRSAVDASLREVQQSVEPLIGTVQDVMRDDRHRMALADLMQICNRVINVRAPEASPSTSLPPSPPSAPQPTKVPMRLPQVIE